MIKLKYILVFRLLRSAILIFMLSISVYSLANNIKVSNNCEIKTLRLAISIAKSGDTVTVEPGIYNEANIIIDKPLTLLGIKYPIIDGQNKNNEIIIIAADSVVLDGFVIQNVGVSYLKDLAGIRIQRKDYFVIKNNKLLNTMFGIYLEKASNGEISNNEIKGKAVEEVSSGNGIHAWYSKNLIISNNIIQGQRDGIYFEFVESSKIINNKSTKNLRYGLHFMFSNNDEYENNLFESNGAGVAVMFSKNINMYKNIFKNNWGSSAYGLLLKEIYDAEIIGNNFYENTTGIKVDGSTRINYLNNNFENNGWAIKFVGGSYENVISNNNFISNSFDLGIASARNNNTIDKNYWSSYTGYDLDKDGIGDIPFRPVKLFSYIVTQTPETMVLMRSLFIDIINYSEKVRPAFTPENVMDNEPLMKKIVF